MKKIYMLCLLLLAAFSCQSLKNSTAKGTYLKRISRVTPLDIRSNTRKIFVREYQFVLEQSNQSRSTIYFETSWKDVELTPDEKAKGLVDVRVRFKIRSRQTRSGPSSTYTIHNLKLIAEVEAYDGSNWVPIKITPQREDYLDKIFHDYKLEFNTGVRRYR